MERLQKMLVFILVLCVVSVILSFSSNTLLARLYGPTEYAQITLFRKIVAVVPFIFQLLVNICVAIWLFSEARKEKAAPWAWVVFGVFFGLMAAVLFYLVRIYTSLKSEANADMET